MSVFASISLFPNLHNVHNATNIVSSYDLNAVFSYVTGLRTIKHQQGSFICVLSAEGLAVGVGFGAIGKTTSATFESAR